MPFRRVPLKHPNTEDFIDVAEQACTSDAVAEPQPPESDSPEVSTPIIEDVTLEEPIPNRPTSDKSKPTYYIQRYPQDYSAILHPDTSEEALRKSLVQPYSLPIVYDAAISRENIQAFLDRNTFHHYKPGASVLDAKDVSKTAAKMFYTENSFTVRHYELHDFFYNPKNTKGLDEPITALIRRITVVITTKLQRWSDKECDDMLEQLRILIGCPSTASITINLVGYGDAIGTDWSTQEPIRVIAPVVKDLMVKFKGFAINKVLLRDIEGKDKPDHQIKNITSYWSEPKPARAGTFEELMKSQLQVWTEPTNTKK